MKVSIITVVYNNRSTIRQAMESVLSQDYQDLEYILVDGASTDGTAEEIRRCMSDHPDRTFKFVSEPDNGIYDAMNKGIRMATGDIVGILNSDDFYVNNQVVSTVVKTLRKTGADSFYADIVVVKSDNVDKVIRYFSGGSFRPSRFAYGWMPPHPTMFIRRKCYAQYGLYKTDYEIAADFELVVRFFLKYGVTYTYFPQVMVKMRQGGVSTRNIRSNWILSKETVRACLENGVRTNIAKVLSKYFLKIWQYVERPAQVSSGPGRGGFSG